MGKDTFLDELDELGGFTDDLSINFGNDISKARPRGKKKLKGLKKMRPGPDGIERFCPECDKWLQLNSFGKKTGYRFEGCYQSWCTPCTIAYRKKKTKPNSISE